MRRRISRQSPKPYFVLFLLGSILPLAAQTPPPVPPVPMAPQQVKSDEMQIRLVVDTLFDDFRNRDGKGVVSCFTGQLPEYYSELIDPAFTPKADSKTPSIDLVIHKAFMTKMASIIPKSPTLDLFVQNIFSPQGNNPIQDQKASDFIDKVQVDGDTAYAIGKAKFKGIPLEIPFSRENGTWKIDLFPMLANLEVIMAFDEMKTGRSPDQEADIYVGKMADFNAPPTAGSSTGTPGGNPPTPIVTPPPSSTPVPQVIP